MVVLGSYATGRAIRVSIGRGEKKGGRKETGFDLVGEKMRNVDRGKGRGRG